jgi:pilus assembly protein CpaB
MRLIFGLVLVVGLGLAGFAVVMAKNYIGAYQSELAKERAGRERAVPTDDVYVATRALKYGEQLTEKDVRQVKWPETAIPEGTFTNAADLFAATGQLRVVVRAMEKDEAIMAVKVTEPGEDAGITSRLSKGMRAFAIKVDVASGVSGFLRPGDKVDVYWTGRTISTDPDDPRGEVTKLIEAAVQLIAVDQTADGDAASATIARTVTVAATPQQVAGLAQAQSTGRLSLSLVGAGDDTIAEAIEVDQRSLLGLEAVQQVEAAPVARTCSIRTRRGAELVEIPIPCSN